MPAPVIRHIRLFVHNAADPMPHIFAHDAIPRILSDRLNRVPDIA